MGADLFQQIGRRTTVGPRTTNRYRWRLAVLLAVASLALSHRLDATSGAAETSGDSRLVAAVKARNTQAIRALLKQRINVNTRQPDGATALHWAAHWDDLDTADLLIRAGANVNAATDHGATALSLACTNGSAPMIQRLLKAGANANATLPTGETALMTCANTGDVESVRSLLEVGADVNRKETLGGQTALMWAAAEKHPEVVRLLVQHGADIHAASKGGFTPLLFAAQQGDVDSARILMDAGAKWDAAASTPSCGPAPRGGGFGEGFSGRLAETTDSKDPLLVSTIGGHEKFAIFLLERGANPNAADCKMSVLHYAIRKGISYINRGDSAGRGDDPRARLPNMFELVKALLARGADPNVKLQRPMRGGVLVSTIGLTPLMLAAAAADVDLMRYLLDHGADWKVTTNSNTTALMLAAGIGRTEDRLPEDEKNAFEAVKLLVELGADVNVRNTDENQTALHGAAFIGANAIVQYLVDKGATMNVMDEMGQTPLSMALGLITKGAINCENAATCYQKIPTGPHPSTAELLRRLGATPVETSGVQLMDVTTEAAKIKQHATEAKTEN
jgi:ankyrin repeat protein